MPVYSARTCPVDRRPLPQSGWYRQCQPRPARSPCPRRVTCLHSRHHADLSLAAVTPSATSPASRSMPPVLPCTAPPRRSPSTTRSATANWVCGSWCSPSRSRVRRSAWRCVSGSGPTSTVSVATSVRCLQQVAVWSGGTDRLQSHQHVRHPESLWSS